MSDALTLFLGEMERHDQPIASPLNSTTAAVIADLRRRSERRDEAVLDMLADTIEFLEIHGGKHRELAEMLAFTALVHRAGLVGAWWDWVMPWTILKRWRLRATLRRMRRMRRAAE